MSRESSADDHDSWRHSLSEGSSSSQLLDDKDQQLEKKNEQLAAAKNEERSLRRENRRLVERIDQLMADYTALMAQHQHLRRTVWTSESSSGGGSHGTGSALAATAWQPFEDLLLKAAAERDDGGASSATVPNKMSGDARYFQFGTPQEFLDGFFTVLTRSMEEEFTSNDNGKWLDEYKYIVECEAVEDVPSLESTKKFLGCKSLTGRRIVRDYGHGGWRLKDFCEAAPAKSADLTDTEVAALRLYTGPCHAPLNAALRERQTSEWATTIACCFSAILKLSFSSDGAAANGARRVYRGVRESEISLPDAFWRPEEASVQNGKFAGGVERSFTSTTTNPAVALDYAGSGPGSIFVIDFEFTSRAASVGWLSQYPHEEELLWPPCLGLSVIGAHESPQWQKKLLIVSAQVSTAKPDTNELLGPRYVPGTAAALAKIEAILDRQPPTAAAISSSGSNNSVGLRRSGGLGGLDVRELTAWRLAGAAECKLCMDEMCLLLGRASHEVCVTTLDLAGCGLDAGNISTLADALRHANCTLTELELRNNMLEEEGANALADALRQNRTLESLGLDGCALEDGGVQALAEALPSNDGLKLLRLANNDLSLNGLQTAKRLEKACLQARRERSSEQDARRLTVETFGGIRAGGRRLSTGVGILAQPSSRHIIGSPLESGGSSLGGSPAAANSGSRHSCAGAYGASPPMHERGAGGSNQSSSRRTSGDGVVAMDASAAEPVVGRQRSLTEGAEPPAASLAFDDAPSTPARQRSGTFKRLLGLQRSLSWRRKKPEQKD